MNLEAQPHYQQKQAPIIDTRITEPGLSPIPVYEPTQEEYEAYFMPFPKPIRDWWIRVWGGESGSVVYSEKRGWFRSGRPADQVHHIRPESELIEQGLDPDQTPAIPLSQDEHVGRGVDFFGNDIPFGEYGHSMHPDMGQAREEYRKGDKEAFTKAAKKHHQRAKKGEKIVNTDEQLDGWLTQQAEDMARRYVQENPDDPKPVVKHRNPTIRKNWTDIFFGTRSYPEDEQ